MDYSITFQHALAAPLGSFAPAPVAVQFAPPQSDRTLNEWAVMYDRIIAARKITAKTLADKRRWVACLCEAMGDRIIDGVLPFELATLFQAVKEGGRETKARRLGFEARDFFNEALLAGWIYRSPMHSLRLIKPTIRRQRLSLEQWHRMHGAASPGSIGARLLRLALVSAQRRADLAAVGLADIWDDHLHIKQQKTGRYIAIPLELRMDAVGLSLRQVIEECRQAAPGCANLLPARHGGVSTVTRLSDVFVKHRRMVLEHFPEIPGKTLPSLHEVRSLAERLYREQGVDTQTLLGHKFPSTTNLYNDERGSAPGIWKTVRLTPRWLSGSAGAPTLAGPESRMA